MSKRTGNSLLITSSLKRYAGFYQRLASGVFSFQEVGNSIIQIAKHAQALRQYDSLDEAAKILFSFPLKEYQAIGQYYLGWNSFMRGNIERGILEHVAQYSPTKYRALAMLSLAAIEARKEDYASELYWLTESLKISPSVEALRGIAIVKAKEGYHKTCLKELENLMPFARISEPLHYYDFLNSYAVELAEVGRMDEARNVSSLTITSPFAPYYPEWRETAEELREPNRSFVAVPLIKREQAKIKTTET